MATYLRTYLKHKPVKLLLSSAIFAATLNTSWALSVGNIQIKSRLGEPLRATVAVTLDTREGLSTDCIRTINSTEGDDSLPIVLGVSTSLENTKEGAIISLATAQSVEEPAARLLIEIGCASPVRREFVLLLDPPVGPSLTAPIALPVTAPQRADAVLSRELRAQSRTSVRASDKKKLLAASKSPANSRDLGGVSGQEATSQEPKSLAPKLANTAKSQASPVKSRRPVRDVDGELVQNSANQALRRASPRLGDRLSVSSADPFITQTQRTTGLHISDELSLTPKIALDDNVKRRLLIERERMAAILRDEDPAQAVITREQAMQERVSKVGTEMTNLRQELQLASQEARRLQAETVPAWWWWIAVGVTAVAAIAIILLLTLLGRARVVRSQADAKPWWAVPTVDQTGESATPNPIEPVSAQSSILSDYAQPSKKEPSAFSRFKIKSPRLFPGRQDPSVTGEIALQDLENSAHKDQMDSALGNDPVSTELNTGFNSEDQSLEKDSSNVTTNLHPDDNAAAYSANVPDSDNAADASNTNYEVVDISIDQFGSSDHPSQAAKSGENTYVETTRPAVTLSLDEKQTNSAGLVDYSVDELDHIQDEQSHDFTKNDADALILQNASQEVNSILSKQPETKPQVTQVADHSSPSSQAVLPAYIPESFDATAAQECQRVLRGIVQTIEQAESAVAKRDTDTALKLLSNLVSEQHDIPPAPWLLAFKLAKENNQRAVYDALAAAFSSRFSRRVPSWDEELKLGDDKGMQGKPDLQEQVWQHWGTPQCIATIYNLLMNFDASEDVFLNLSLQRDLLNLANICPLEGA